MRYGGAPALTGVTSEHALFFLYGTGTNGKSVADVARRHDVITAMELAPKNGHTTP